jgi:hypothetical protein
VGIIQLTIIKDYPKTLPVPKGHAIYIYETDMLYLVEFLPNKEDRHRTLCPSGMRVDFTKNDMPKNKDCWIKITNPYDLPLEITIEFFVP